MTEFVHLHVHTHYSLLDSTVKVPDLVGRTAALGMKAVAITDHGNMFGAVELQQKAGGKGIKSIVGVEVNVVPDHAALGPKTRPSHLVLLAENLEGYKNLVRLVSKSQLRELDRRGRPVVDASDLRAYREGVIALSGDIGGEIPQALLRGEKAAAMSAFERYTEIFGRDRFYFEIQRAAGIPEMQDACAAIVEMARETNMPFVATNNVHYLKADDYRAHAILMCVGLEKRIDRKILDDIPLRTLHLTSPAEMADIFSDLPDALARTLEVAERCDLKIPLGKSFLPQFPVPGGLDEGQYLKRVALEGLDRRFAELKLVGAAIDEAAYRERLLLELEIIVSMKFPGYFLIVWDFIRWAKENDIPVGPGRGSGAGSLVAYALRITDLDPIQYGLLFERFLNPERVSMPDFDVDFCQNRRGEVIDYVSNKFGRDQVGQIVTFGQLKAKNAVRDVARVLNLSYADADRISKLVPDELNIKLSEAYEKEPKLRQAVADDPTIEFLYQSACAVEGNNRNTGMHAAGIVISGDPLWEYVPVFRGAAGELVTQYSKDDVEAAGLVKFDFLGLKTLTVIDNAVKLVNRGRAEEQKLDFARVSFVNPGVYDIIKSGDTAGIFQMESDGFQKLMRQLKPDCFEDVVAAVALYRPGPLGSGMVEQFIDCKHQRREVVYPHPWLERVLKETYGVMVYQEQVMQVAQILSGYSLGQADLLRRAMGKKKPEEMDKQRAMFVKGALEKGVPEAKSNEIFDLMAHFAGYGFNKSHSAAYAVITFQTAYLKKFHPTEFYAALMTNDAGSTDKVVRYIEDARARNLRVLPPDVNASDRSFSVAGGAIRFGMGAIKGIGDSAIDAIQETTKNGPVKSLFDFCDRVDQRRCSRRVMEALIRCGAFDSVHPEAAVGVVPKLEQVGRWRAQMFAVLETAIERGAQAQRDRETGQSSLFSMFAGPAQKAVEPESYPNVRPWTDKFTLNAERETMGFYVSGHPLDRYSGEIQKFTDANSLSIRRKDARSEVRIAGVFTSVRDRVLKSGDGKMAFGQLSDKFGEIEVVVYSRQAEELLPLMSTDEPVLVTGSVRIEGDGEERTWKISANKIQLLQEVRNLSVNQVDLRVDANQFNAGFLQKLTAVFAKFPGPCTIRLVVNFVSCEVDFAVGNMPRVSATDDFAEAIGDVIGFGRVTFRQS